MIKIVYFRYLPNGDKEAIRKLEHVLLGLNGFEFGSFDQFESIYNVSLSELDHIDITELYKLVRISLNDFRCIEQYSSFLGYASM